MHELFSLLFILISWNFRYWSILSAYERVCRWVVQSHYLTTIIALKLTSELLFPIRAWTHCTTSTPTVDNFYINTYKTGIFLHIHFSMTHAFANLPIRKIPKMVKKAPKIISTISKSFSCIGSSVTVSSFSIASS